MIKEKLKEKIDGLFQQWDKPDSPGCALAIIKDGKIVYKKGYGMADLEHDVPITVKLKRFYVIFFMQFPAKFLDSFLNINRVFL